MSTELRSSRTSTQSRNPPLNLEAIEVTENVPADITFPEGGFRAWAAVAGAWLAQACTFGYLNSFGVYQDFYVREYLSNHSSSQISWIGSVQVLFLLSLGLLTGRAFDEGYFYHLMLSGSLIFPFSLFMLSLSHPGQYYQVFLSQGLGVGIGLGLTYVPCLGIVTHYFKRRRTLAMGIVASGSSVGGVIHPIMLNNLFEGSAGFHQGVRASAALNLGLLAIANALMRTRLPPRKAAGFIPGIANFARDPPYVAAVAGAFLIIIGLFFPLFYLQLDAINHGVSSTLAFYSLPILYAASIIGRVLPNVVADKTGVFNMMVPCTFVCAILVFAMLGLRDAASVIVIAILYGFFSGAYISLLAPMLASLANDVSEIGARMGLCFTCAGFGSLIGSPISGALLSAKFAWWRPIVFNGILLIGGTVMLAISRSLVTRKRDTQKV